MSTAVPHSPGAAMLQNAALGVAKFSSVGLGACDFNGADLSATTGLELARTIGTGSMAEVMPMDFKRSFEDPGRFQAGYAPSEAVDAARDACDALEDTIFAARLAHKDPPGYIVDELPAAKARFIQVVNQERKAVAARWTATAETEEEKEEEAGSGISDPDAPPNAAVLDAAIEACRTELAVLKAGHTGKRPPAGRVAELEAELKRLTRQRRPSGASGVVSKKAKHEADALAAARRHGVAHLDLTHAIVGGGPTALFWKVASGFGGTPVSKDNLLAQKRQVARAIALLSDLRGTTITADTVVEYLADWADLRALENQLVMLDQQRGPIRANGAVLKVIELVLHPYSEPPADTSLKEEVWGTPIRGLAAMETLAPAFRANPPPKGVLSAAKTIGRRLRDPGFPAILERLALEDGYLDVILSTHAKVENAFSQLVLSGLFGVATFLANVAFVASHIEDEL